MQWQGDSGVGGMEEEQKQPLYVRKMSNSSYAFTATIPVLEHIANE